MTRCAPAADARGDQRYATAPPVARWLLVERPGPWGRDPFAQSRMDGRVAAAVAARCRAAGVRVLLVRRPGRSGPGTRRWAYVDSRLGREGCWWGTYADTAELLTVPLAGSAVAPSVQPAYLVCTHGGRDPCCAIRGRPVAAALSRLRPESTWECSHVGGDRFAANVVVLPHGFYYGHVTPGLAAELVAATEGGRVLPPLLRGRSALAMPVQAAQHHARLGTGELAADALAPQEVEALDGGAWRVVLAGAAGPVAVTVRAGRAAPQRLTCGATRLEAARVFDLVALDQPGDTRG